MEVATQTEISTIIDQLGNPNLKDRIKELDAAIIKNINIDLPIEHKFAPNLYLREVFVPAGTLFTTYVHKTEHPFFGSMGELLIWEEGTGWQHMLLPCTGITEAGTKRIVYSLTDVVFTTIHYNPTNTQNIDELHDMLFETYENNLLSLEEQKLIK